MQSRRGAAQITCLVVAAYQGGTREGGRWDGHVMLNLPPSLKHATWPDERRLRRRRRRRRRQQQQQQQQRWRHVRPARHTKAPLGSGPTPWLMTTGEHVHVRAYLHALFGRHCDKATYQEAENALLAQLEESRDADDEACTALHDILRVQVDRVLHQRMVRAIIF